MGIILTTDDTRAEVFLKAEQANIKTGGGGTSDHRELTNRDAPNQHPMSAITGLQDELDGINAKIPPQASYNNQLADKDFVNSSIENVAAYFITKDAAGNPFATKAELNAATVFYSGGQVRVPTRNDYTVVLADESKTISATGENPTTRYLYDNGWNYQYIVNNSGLTADQWKAVNSGATAEIIESVAKKQDKLTAGDRISIDSNNVISADEQVFVATYGETTYSEISAAYNAGKSVICNYNNRRYYLFRDSGTQCIFVTNYADASLDYLYSVVVFSSNVWESHGFDRRKPLIDYVDGIVGDIESAINEIRGVTAE